MIYFIFLFRMTVQMTVSDDCFGLLFLMTTLDDCFGCLFQSTFPDDNFGYCFRWRFRMTILDRARLLICRPEWNIRTELTKRQNGNEFSNFHYLIPRPFRNSTTDSYFSDQFVFRPPIPILTNQWFNDWFEFEWRLALI